MNRAMKALLPCAAVPLLLVGCAHDPIIDPRGVNQPRYQQDLAECKSYAAAVNTPAEAGKYAAAGAVFGGAMGAIWGDSSRHARRGAGAGAVTGAAKGGVKAERRKQRVVYNCLRGRGYKVLG